MRSPHLVLPLTYCGVEQWLARQSHKLKVGGSIPPPATTNFGSNCCSFLKRPVIREPHLVFNFHFESSKFKYIVGEATG